MLKYCQKLSVLRQIILTDHITWQMYAVYMILGLIILYVMFRLPFAEKTEQKNQLSFHRRLLQRLHDWFFLADSESMEEKCDIDKSEEQFPSLNEDDQCKVNQSNF